MSSIIEYQQQIEQIYHSLTKVDEETTIDKAPGKWSKKEILGHLCDSAINNIYRLMHAQSSRVFQVIPYDQLKWVNQAGYQRRTWLEILSYWHALNTTFLSVSMVVYSKNEIQVEVGEQIKPLEFLIHDYFDHLFHHIRQIMPYD